MLPLFGGREAKNAYKSVIEENFGPGHSSRGCSIFYLHQLGDEGNGLGILPKPLRESFIKVVHALIIRIIEERNL
jgi:hypothetical protein